MKVFYNKNEFHEGKIECALIDDEGCYIMVNGMPLAGYGVTKAEAKAALQEQIANELKLWNNKLTQALNFVTNS